MIQKCGSQCRGGCKQREHGGGGGNPHTLHTKCEKQCNLHIKRGMPCQIQAHTQAYGSMCGGM